MRKGMLAATILLLAFLAPALHAQNGQSPPKKVNLSWTQSPTLGVTENGVYRGTVSGGPYTNILVSTTPITTFIDPNVTPGTTYFYVVTAKTSATDESAFSNEAKATIPLPTAAPTGLTAAVP